MSDHATPTYHPHPEFVQKAHISGMDAYHALCQKADSDYPGFWADLARDYLSWKKPFTQALNDTQAPFFKWFEDGLLNVSYNCLDRHIEKGLGEKTALIFEADGGEDHRLPIERKAEA